MATGYNCPQTFVKAFDNDGNPAPGAKLYAFLAGSTIPKKLYYDYALTQPCPHPLVADSDGNFAQYFLEYGAYKLSLFDQDDNQLRPPEEPIFGTGSGESIPVVPPDAQILGSDGTTLVSRVWAHIRGVFNDGDIFQQINHGFADGDVVYQVSSTAPSLRVFAKAQANSYETLARFVVVHVIDNNNFVIANSRGWYLPGIDAGPMWLSQETAGLYTSTKPESGIIQYLGWSDGVSLHLDIDRPRESEPAATFEVNISGAGSGWIKIGTIATTPGHVIVIDIDAIRDNDGKAEASKYALSISINADGGNSAICYMGARVLCEYGSDYLEGVSLDPIADIALLRASGYASGKADLLIKLNGSKMASMWRVTDPANAFSKAVATGQSDPGTGTDTTHATRKLIYTV